MSTIEKYTCVRFHQRSNEYDYVKFINGDGCSSRLGRGGGMQEITLQKNGCMSRGTIVHEIIHALGYDHMHSSYDRDRYVHIDYNNIKRDSISQFDLVSPRVFSNFGTNYDLFSVMHYDKKAFSRNGLDTIVPRNRRFIKVIGQRQGMSRNDVRRLNNMYQCF
jgi:Astacin (Peptidase family M12A)